MPLRAAHSTFAVGVGSARKRRKSGLGGSLPEQERAPELAEYRNASLAHMVESRRFNSVIALLIVINAIVLGAETYSGLSSQASAFLSLANSILYVIFVGELLLRIASYGRKPWMFFTDGWNVFDFIIIGGALVPFMRGELTVLRLFRLARIARVIRVLPDARVLLLTITRSIPAVLSMLVLTVIVIFLYGMVGWFLFGEALPEIWGNIGRAMLTLFVLLTLEDFPRVLEAAQEVTQWATVYFVSYILVASFVIVNLFIGIIVSAMDHVRDEELEASRESVDPWLIASHIRDLQLQLEQFAASINALAAREASSADETGHSAQDGT